MSYFCQKPNPISFFFSWLKYKSQSTCSLILKPRYLTCAFRGIYWPLILKFRCFVMLLLDLGLNSKISVLLVFKDILFALSHVVRSFKSWLICLFIFFKELSTSIKLVLSANWCTLLNFKVWFRSLMYIRKSSWPRMNPVGTQALSKDCQIFDQSLLHIVSYLVRQVSNQLFLIPLTP